MLLRPSPASVALAVALAANLCAPDATAAPPRLADSPLTALAQAEAVRAVGWVQARDEGVLGLETLGAARLDDVVAVRLGLALETGDGPASGARVLSLGLILTADGLFVESAGRSELRAVPASRRDDAVWEVAGTLADSIAAGRLLTSNRAGLEACRALRGDLCGDSDGIHRPIALAPALRAGFGGGLRAAALVDTSVLARLDDGRLLELAASWSAPKPRKPVQPTGPLQATAPTRWRAAPPSPPPTDHLDPSWSRWCARDWPRLVEPPRDLASRCLLQLLSDAYDSPVVGGRIADMMMLDFDPMPPPGEAGIPVTDLEAMKRHLAHRCTAPDTSACGRVLESLELAITRKLSLFEDVALGDFGPLLAAALAGDPLADDLGASGRSRWSELTLDKLAAAVWVRNGYLILREDLAAFFHGARGPEAPDGAGVVPIPWPDSRLRELSDTDRANLARIERMRR